MSKIFGILATAAALTVAAPALAQDRSSNTFGGASFESVPNGYRTDRLPDAYRYDVVPQSYRYDDGFAPFERQFRGPVSQPRFMNRREHESGSSKRG